jgi:magnesium transporter
MADLSQDIVQEIGVLVESRADALIQNLLPDLHPADLADLFDYLGSEDRAYVFGLLSSEQRSAVLLELDERRREELVDEMAPREITQLVEHLDSDDAADLVGELEEPVRTEVLSQLEKSDADELRTLLAYPDDSAGGIMAGEFLSLPPTTRVVEAVDAIRAAAEDIDPYFVYVADEGSRLRGTVPLRALLLSKAGTTLEEILTPAELVIPPEMDQEEVARLFKRYDAVEAPVVDALGRMLGVITVDDVVDVIEEEAEEDIARLAGTGDESASMDSVLYATRRRLPWLLVGLLGGLLSALVLSRFEVSLRTLVSLAFFVPVITATGGNVAIQSSSITIRGLALGPTAYRAMGRRLFREFLVSLLNGLACGIILGGIVAAWLHEPMFAVLIAGSLFSVVLLATMLGSLVPILLNRVGIDPALAAGPFLTASNDIVGILVYLSLARLLLIGRGAIG